MENNCQNCENLITENFCSNCGQKRYKRIDKKYLIDEFQYTILHTNKGFFYTIKNLFKNPGKTAREFIDGNRVNHYKPILLAFVLTGISTFISFKLIGLNDMQAAAIHSYQNNDEQVQKLTEYAVTEFMKFFTNYFTIIIMLSIPIFALISKICFKKWNHNYYEHIVMNAFFYSAYVIYTIIFLYPILFLLKDNHILFLIISQLSFLGIPFLLVWFFKEIYNTKPLGDIIIRVLGFGTLAIISFIPLFMIIGFSFAYHLSKTGQIDKLIPQ